MFRNFTSFAFAALFIASLGLTTSALAETTTSSTSNGQAWSETGIPITWSIGAGIEPNLI
jgi:hypothetical protein